MRSKIFILSLFCLALCCRLLANVALPAIFNDHMVLQQQSEITIWGWAKPNEEVTITPSWQIDPAKVKANNHGNWMITINTPVAGGPFTITVKGYNTIVINDILIGEVWLASGQSNMEMSAAWGITDGDKYVSEADFPNIRLFQVSTASAKYPQIDLKGSWERCTPESMRGFSAAAYFFAKSLHENLEIPIGIINSSWGGSPAETWINAQVIEDDERLKKDAAIHKPVPWCPVEPGLAYNAMIAPIVPFKIAGVIWYQGEANVSLPQEYQYVFSSLIKTWRKEWGLEFPFYYVQLAPFNYGQPMQCSLLQESQRNTLELPKTGMVVTNDIGNPDDIHPKNKKDVGLRLAKWALAKTYGKEDIVYSGPLYRGMDINKNKITLHFDHTTSGLVIKTQDTGNLFQIAGEDHIFFDASVKINGNSLVVSSKKVKNPVAVRYAWSNTAEGILFNGAGLPASSFRTDQWEIKP